MRLRRGEHARFHADRWALTLGGASPRRQAMVTGRWRWSW